MKLSGASEEPTWISYMFSRSPLRVDAPDTWVELWRRAYRRLGRSYSHGANRVNAVLIVVDMLNDFFDRSPALAMERSRLVAHTNALVGAFRAGDGPVVWVRQAFAPDLHDAFLEMRINGKSITIIGTPGCELLPELDFRQADAVIVKKRYSAFFGTDLEARLSKLHAKVLVIAGVNTHACVRMTAIDAYQRDYDVIVAADCVASSDLEHHEVTLRYFDGNIAQVLSSAEIINMFAAGNA